MIIAIGCDHAGIKMKEKVRAILQELGHGVIDFGTEGEGSVDYPDYAFKAANSVISKESEGGVLICMTGNGMVMAANKVKGIRATLCLSNDMAYYARRHNDSNVLVLSQKYTDETELADIVKTWTVTEFEGGRHIPRLEKIAELEKNE
jgi:ribose 5-phosphate isomerase B